MNHLSRRTFSIGLKTLLVLAGFGHALGRTPEGDSTVVRKVSEESLGFGEGEVHSIGGRDAPSPQGRAARLEDPSRAVDTSLSANGVRAEERGGAVVAPASVPSRVADPGGPDANDSLYRLKRDELFERIFKKAPPPRLREFSVRLFLDDREIDQVKILWDKEFKRYQFNSGRLAVLLDTVLSVEKREEVNGKNSHYDSDHLRANQFGVDLDEAEFVLRLSTPPRLKRLQEHPLLPAPPELRFGEEIKPAKFSAFLNGVWSQSWMYNERFFDDDSSRTQWERYNGVVRPEREPILGELDGAVRTLDWVLMGSGTVREPDTGDWGARSFYRKETQIVRDFEAWNSRLSLLDVSATHDGANFSVPSLGGVDLMLGNAIIPDVRTNETTLRFFLNRPARVTIVVNGEHVKTLSLGSGAHNISGFNGRAGENQVEVQVQYLDGSTDIIPYQFTQVAPQIMQVGDRRGSLSGGFRRLGEYRYGKGAEDFVATGTYAQGISPFMNGKGGVGLHRDLQVASAGLLWLEDSVTTWALNATVSHDSGGKIGQQWALQYYQQLRPASLIATASFIQGSFRNSFFSTGAAIQPVKYRLSLNVGSPVWKGTLNINSNIAFNRGANAEVSPIDYAFGANYNISAWRGLSVNALGNCVISSGQFNPTASLTLSYFFNTGRHSLYAMNQTFNQRKYNVPLVVRNTVNDTMRIGSDIVIRSFDSASVVSGSYENEWKNLSNSGWSWSEGMGMVGGKAFSVSGNYAPDQYGLRLGGQRTTNHADLSAGYSLADQNQFGLMSRNHYLSARVGTSLQFADGVFAIGRPVQDGFVLVTGRNELSSTGFQINPSEQYNSEHSNGGRFLAASYGLLSPYRIENIQVKPVNPPPGTFLDGDRYYVRNTYQQGFVLRIGKLPKVFLRMRLLDETNQTVGYTTFRVFVASDTSIAIYQSFSSKDGMVQIADLEPGKKYIIRFGEDAFIKDLVITIPVGAPSILNLGDQKVQHETFSQLAKLSLGASDPVKKTQSVASTPDQIPGAVKPAGRTPVPATPAVEDSRIEGTN